MRNDDPVRHHGRKDGHSSEGRRGGPDRPGRIDQGQGEQYEQSPPFEDPHIRYAHRSMPKGYTRSDERIREDVCERLSRSGLDVSDVSVEVSNGQVSLEGTVSDRYVKHAIEDCADDCMGVQDIDNRIRVRKTHTPPGAGQGTAA